MLKDMMFNVYNFRCRRAGVVKKCWASRSYMQNLLTQRRLCSGYLSITLLHTSHSRSPRHTDRRQPPSHSPVALLWFLSESISSGTPSELCQHWLIFGQLSRHEPARTNIPLSAVITTSSRHNGQNFDLVFCISIMHRMQNTCPHPRRTGR